MTGSRKPDEAELRARLTGGLRYCINSASLDFKRGDQEKK